MSEPEDTRPPEVDTRPPEPDTAPEDTAPIDLGSTAVEVMTMAEVAPPIDMAPPVDTRPAEPWKPALNVTWDWQMTVPVNTTGAAQVFIIDLFDNPASVIDDLHARGKKVICHVDLGTFDERRPDGDKVPSMVRGSPVRGDQMRRWLDISQVAALLPFVRGRLDLAAQKRCDGVVAENLNGWSELGLIANDQLYYNRTVAGAAHMRQLPIGLRNNVVQAADLYTEFDFFLAEQCYQKKECNRLSYFITAGKPVFDVEITLALNAFCPMAKTDKVNAIKKRMELNAVRETCPP